MQDNTRQDKATQYNIRQDNTRQDKTTQYNTRQNNASHDKTMQDNTMTIPMIRQHKARQYNTT